MTVGELISRLQSLPQDAQAVVQGQSEWFAEPVQSVLACNAAELYAGTGMLPGSECADSIVLITFHEEE